MVVSFSSYEKCISSSFRKNIDLLLGPKVNLKTRWIGKNPVENNLSILVLAGHADSQGVSGRGTLGEAVALNGALPMDPNMSDELFWNLKLQKEIVNIGQTRGLNIDFYDPGIRDIKDPNNVITNWSLGAQHVSQGGYAIEIHFDGYGEYGVGSGLIPPISNDLNTIDEALANSFGRFPLFFRGGLGAPRRQIRILEVGKLEGKLEKNLRNVKTRKETLKLIANRIVDAFLVGLK